MYMHNEIGFAPAATPTDILTLTPPKNNLLLLKRFRARGLATTAGFLPIILLRRSAVNTGGTSTNPTPARKVTSGVAAAESVLTRYTANPAGLGAAGDTIFNERLFMNLVSQYHDLIEIVWDDHSAPKIASGQFLALNLAGAAVPAGGALDFLLEWDEQ